jgi:hypothetical protein
VVCNTIASCEVHVPICEAEKQYLEAGNTMTYTFMQYGNEAWVKHVTNGAIDKIILSKVDIEEEPNVTIFALDYRKNGVHGTDGDGK